MRDYQVHTFANGIRLVHKQVTHTKIAHCGFVLDIGSRDERPEQQGLAHFWEHMAFKGTRKRKAYHILNRLDSVGGELNAYTSKEKICFYASVLDQHFEKALDLLKDITFDSIFPEKQIERERNVILEEMAMYHDAPEDAIQDDFDEVVFGGHPLGKNILGTVDHVRAFSRNDFQAFIRENLDTSRLIFSSVSNLPLKQVVRLAERYLKDIPTYSVSRTRLPFQGYLPNNHETYRELTQAQLALGRPAFSLTDKNRLPFFLLINLLGGPGMNSRLNLALREKYGFVYSVDAHYTPYLDTGLMAIFFGTEPKQVNRSLQLVHKELRTMREKKLGTLQLRKAKEQLMGQLAMSEENNMGLMLMLGKSLLDLDKVDHLDTIFSQIEAVEADQLQDLAQEMFAPDQLSLLSFLPKD